MWRECCKCKHYGCVQLLKRPLLLNQWQNYRFVGNLFEFIIFSTPCGAASGTDVQQEVWVGYIFKCFETNVLCS